MGVFLGGVKRGDGNKCNQNTLYKILKKLILINVIILHRNDFEGLVSERNIWLTPWFFEAQSISRNTGDL